MKENLELNIKKNKQILNITSLIKVVIVVLFLIFIITYFTNHFNTYLYLSLLMIVLFIVIAVFSEKYYLEKKYLDNMSLAIFKHEARQKGNVTNQKGFFDKGNEFKRIYSKTSLRDKYLLEDIDIFGKNSLFEHLSSAKSVLGRNKLALSLCHGDLNIASKKDKIYELGKRDILVDLEASLAFNNITEDIDKDSYIESLSLKFKPKKNLYLGLIFVFLIDILLIVLGSLNIINPLFIIIGVIINIFYATFFKDPLYMLNTTSLYNSIGQNQNVLKHLAKLDLEFISNKYNKEYFNSNLKKFKRLSTLWQVISYRNNILFKIIFNGLCCFDAIYQLIFNKLQLKDEEIFETLEDIANLEVYASYANLVYDYQASLGESNDKLEFIDLTNILVKDCVPNSFTLKNGTIITGSNMSGKTTFLRTIGEAVLLYNACGIVPAAAFKSPNYMLYTALRIKDDLALGVSSFYAEIEKIKEMITDASETKKIALIDEIFKGTNTLDRVYGAKMLIKKLEELDYDFIISTHDFELCEVKSIVNFHFAEQYSHDYKEISFDYKIKEGKSVSTNAIFLLKKSGIID